jgi:hypothetical protein
MAGPGISEGQFIPEAQRTRAAGKDVRPALPLSVLYCCNRVTDAHPTHPLYFSQHVLSSSFRSENSFRRAGAWGNEDAEYVVAPLSMRM